MPSSIILLWAAVLWAGPVTSLAHDLGGFGPLPVRNLHPVQLMFVELEAESARLLPVRETSIRLQIEETNTILNEIRPDANGVIKFETLRTGVQIRYGFSPRIEVGLAISAIYRFPGVLNDLIETVEEAVADLNPSRIDLNRTPYAYRVQVAGITLFAGSNWTFGLSDLTVHAKVLMIREQKGLPHVAVRLALKLPTGRRDEGFGSGRPELAMGFALDKHLTHDWIVYLNGSLAFSRGRVEAPGVSLKTAAAGMIGVEWRAREDLSAHLQFARYNSHLGGTTLMMIDGEVNELAFGVSYVTRPGLIWQLYGIENLSTPGGTSTDFTFGFALSWHF